MGNNSQSRKWSLVINNPLEAGLDHTAISEKLHLFSPDYYCMADEIATTGTYHTHVFFYAPSPSRFSTVKKRFPIAHIEKAYGSVQENRSYLRKDGRWADFRGMGRGPAGASGETPGDVPTRPEYPGRHDHHGNH